MIRVFVGTPSCNEDLESQAVLEWSLRKHHPADDLDITWMKLSKDPQSFWYSDKAKNEGWLTRGWATPFSAFRWGVPAYCNFEGKAIYLDIDMIVMDDIAKLWNVPINGNAFVIAKDIQTFCCSVFDCARARHHLPPIHKIKRDFAVYARLRRNFQQPHVQRFPPNENWNCLDGETFTSIHDPRCKIVHCTAIPTQPQMKYALPRLQAKGQKHWSTFTPKEHPRKDIIDLFDRTLREAIENGYKPEKYETQEIFGEYHRAL